MRELSRRRKDFLVNTKQNQLKGMMIPGCDPRLKADFWCRSMSERRLEKDKDKAKDKNVNRGWKERRQG
jgi:hypothetical protein